MNKLFKIFIFTNTFIFLSIIIISSNLMGYDDKNILLIGLNPILNILVYSGKYRSFIWNNGPNFNMYLLHFVSFICYGLIFDILTFPFKKIGDIVRNSKNINE